MRIAIACLVIGSCWSADALVFQPGDAFTVDIPYHMTVRADGAAGSGITILGQAVARLLPDGQSMPLRMHCAGIAIAIPGDAISSRRIAIRLNQATIVSDDGSYTIDVACDAVAVSPTDPTDATTISPGIPAMLRPKGALLRDYAGSHALADAITEATDLTAAHPEIFGASRIAVATDSRGAMAGTYDTNMLSAGPQKGLQFVVVKPWVMTQTQKY